MLPFTVNVILDENFSESSAMGQNESEEIAETDYIGKLSMFINQKKSDKIYGA